MGVACAIGAGAGAREPHRISDHFHHAIKQGNDEIEAFKVADANGDGKLDLEEFIALINEVHSGYYSREVILCI